MFGKLAADSQQFFSHFSKIFDQLQKVLLQNLTVKASMSNALWKYLIQAIVQPREIYNNVKIAV